ncbi:MAG: hypothetical protein Q9M36_00930 [Sulfurovum sp.]|nr:hypothetical protein [Sulfurovum sp.]
MKPRLTFGNISPLELFTYFLIEEKEDNYILDISNIDISKESENLLNTLISENKKDFIDYSEEEIKMLFISPILYDISLKGNNVREWYERELSFEFDDVIISGKTDFMLASGSIFPKEPYFFIQEYKKSIPNGHPKWQLLSELLVTINKNGFKPILGSYNIGQYWHFVKLIRENDKYILSSSESYDSLKIDDLKIIYKNLQAVKRLYIKE